ncbi:helix-turn-helix domain-containing protein [Streptomyces sp. NBC_01446]|uniref:helix-turn-helix domain-containing protein n=1 Tax=Streptomyces sp. NBC_01446 TaxID=2903870 RepID=UPI002B1CAB80|nr:helix-turn-helix domain-containing protein [Streptomyces sp. NBC_01446]
MEAARSDLVDPAPRSSPVNAVAARRGFPRGAGFSRAFRTAYGITPSEYRSRAPPPTRRRAAERVMAPCRQVDCARSTYSPAHPVRVGSLQA